MQHTDKIDVTELGKIIVGRVEPHIYAFSTGTIPNYLKVGDTYRPLETRLNEWRKSFRDLVKQFADVATTDNETFFRDYSVHQFLTTELGRKRLMPDDFPGRPYSQEFFKHTSVQDVKDAIADIRESYLKNDGKYQFYKEGLPEEHVYVRNETYEPRPNQQETIRKFRIARENHRENLLMYAVMRYGKSFTSMCCATEMGAKVVVIVSAKADVKEEWKKTVESHIRFEEYKFIDGEKLLQSNTFIRDTLLKRKKIAIFLTLQDLQGKDVKSKHQELFQTTIDLLIIDETHFGARGEKYGAVLQDLKIEKKGKSNSDPKERDTFYLDDLTKSVKVLQAKVRLHLSGTPYRILMGDEFQPEDIIAFCQFTDIVAEQKKWNESNLDKDEWENPYYGFPQMVRFAFHPNASARRKLKELKESGITYAFSALFRPKSIRKDTEHQGHKFFCHEQEILDLMEVIDGTKSEEGMLGFLDYEKIKEGEMCRHIVCVLPFRASCDALEKLIKDHKEKFKNLNQYEIINIAGVDNDKQYKDTNAVKARIKSCERENRKTLTLTVNRMLTGSTVEEWDTMIYLKDTASPQEYDQAIFRLQNQYVKTYHSEDEKVIKYNMKPQTLLVDFDPNRMFVMQEQKAQIYNVNTDKNGNTQLEKRIRNELDVSPIVTINKNKIELVISTNILDAVREYSKEKSVVDEATAIPVDFSLWEIDEIRTEIDKQAKLGSKQGLKIAPTEGEGTDIDLPEKERDDGGGTTNPNTTPAHSSIGDTMEDDFKKKFATYYSRILFFAFLTKDKIISLQELIERIEATEENRRIARNLDLKVVVLKLIKEKLNPYIQKNLDYKIHNLNSLAHDESLQPMERASVALNKFGRLSSSEVVTPQKVASEMVSTLPREEIKDTTKILDIASKQGEFVYAVYKNFGKAVADNFYSIPTSKAAYEFTRRVYELLELDVTHIESRYNSYDLIKEHKPMINKNKIMINGQELEFEIVVGNPPYQEERDSNRKEPVYHHFYNTAFSLSDIVTLITPGRFLFRVGQTPMEWMERMLNDTHFKVVDYFKKSEDVFPSVDIKGGVVIAMRNTKEDFGAIGVFSDYKELTSILNKVSRDKNFVKGAFSNIVSSRGQYKFSNFLFEQFPYVRDVQGKGTGSQIASNSLGKLPELFLESKPNDGEEYIQIMGRVGNRRVKRWIRRSYVNPVETLDYYKVIVPHANGTGAIGEVLSTPVIGQPVIGQPVIGHTDTFLSIGKFDNETEAEACLKYIKTKFARTMLGTLKVTQNGPSSTYANVPLQDFTNNSDIDWSQSVADIDRQLYRKYGLSEEEQQFIESMIKPME